MTFSSQTRCDSITRLGKVKDVDRVQYHAPLAVNGDIPQLLVATSVGFVFRESNAEVPLKTQSPVLASKVPHRLELDVMARTLV
jgi:hypothetical protein